jgi:hypothetical protein
MLNSKKLKTMKIIKYLFLTILSGVVLSSCSDAYDVDPGDEITDENAITNVADLESALTGVYASIGGRSFIEWSAYFTDETRKGDLNAGQGVQVHTWSINSGNTEAESYYSGIYGTINRVNTVLGKIDQISVNGEADVNARERVRAELLAIRAMCHFDLLRFFSPAYEASSLGVPIVDKVIIYEKLPRNTFGEVIAFVKEDLATAYETLSTLSDNSDVTRLTPVGVQAIRARVALYNKEYNDAITFANDVINVIPLATPANYNDIWLDTEDHVESAFKLRRAVGDGAVGTVFTETDGRVYFNISYDLFDQFTSGDVRATAGALYDPASTLNNLIVGKYNNRAGNPQLADIKLYRVAEMYLIVAEAQVLKPGSDLDAGEAAINTLRASRRTNASALPDLNFTDVTDAINKILAERRKELAFEGHRFFDLKRLNRGVDRIPSDVVLNPFAEDLPAGDYRFTLPIPAAAIQYNNNLVPNPNYTSQ